MCKVFKIKTSSGLVTQTTDPEIVRCLLDNYDGELSIETKKQQVCDKPQLAELEDIQHEPIEASEITEDDWVFNVQPFSYENKLIYIKGLRNVLNIRLDIAKEYAENGFKVPVNTKVLFNGLTGLLNAFHIPYTIDK